MNTPIIKQDKICVITDIPGYSPNISRLICMMNNARNITLNIVKRLTVEELDFQFDEKSNSIGALLLHFAATDFYYQKYSFEERELTEEETKKWKPAMDLGESGRNEIKGNEVKYYIDILTEIREKTYELLKEKDDHWLEKELYDYGYIFNNYYTWFHVLEDEINHRGQINWLLKRIRNQKK